MKAATTHPTDGVRRAGLSLLRLAPRNLLVCIAKAGIYTEAVFMEPNV
jgi:hypothetical protein